MCTRTRCFCLEQSSPVVANGERVTDLTTVRPGGPDADKAAFALSKFGGTPHGEVFAVKGLALENERTIERFLGVVDSAPSVASSPADDVSEALAEVNRPGLAAEVADASH